MSPEGSFERSFEERESFIPKNHQRLYQPLWCTVVVAPFADRTGLTFLQNDVCCSSNVHSSALPPNQWFIVQGLELRTAGIPRLEVLRGLPLSWFQLQIGNRIYSELPLVSVLSDGGFTLKQELLLEPQTHFSAYVEWRPLDPAILRPQGKFRLYLTLLLNGVLFRPVA